MLMIRCTLATNFVWNFWNYTNAAKMLSQFSRFSRKYLGSSDWLHTASGMSKEEWKKLKEKERNSNNKNLGKVGITKFQSRSMSDWQKAGGKNLFPVDPKSVKSKKDLPYVRNSCAFSLFLDGMQRLTDIFFPTLPRWCDREEPPMTRISKLPIHSPICLARKRRPNQRMNLQPITPTGGHSSKKRYRYFSHKCVWLPPNGFLRVPHVFVRYL